MIHTPIVTFDIETIPDPAALRASGLAEPDLDDAAAVLQAQARRLEKTGSDFLPVHCQRVLVISCTFRHHEGLKIHSFVDQGGQEGQVVQSFFRVIEKHAPQLVSWNGGGFDLPVLHYRGLVHGVTAPKYWDMGEDDREMKWNNYISRYHTRHLDLMDLLALYQARANAPMDVLAKLCGFPGKLGMDGSKVYEAWLAGQTDDIRRYCETDVMNTYLLYCRYQFMRGALSAGEYAGEIDLVRHTLGTLAAQESHWQEYLDAWPESSSPNHV